MAIFELDGGHGTLVQPMRPRADSFDADSASLVTDHLSALLGEQVLPVRRGGPGGPHLLALDAAARPVVVEVVQLLDEAGLVRALRHAGGATRLSRADLARMYAGGAESFEADLAVFRDRAPILHTRAAGAEGVRLVVVCAEVADGLLDAVEFVTGGLHVDVLRLGVTQGPGGRRYVDVSPLRTSTTEERRAVEPGPRTGAVRVTPRGAVTDPTPVVRTPAPEADGAAPDAGSGPAGGAVAPGDAAEPGRLPEPDRAAAGPVGVSEPDEAAAGPVGVSEPGEPAARPVGVSEPDADAGPAPDTDRAPAPDAGPATRGHRHASAAPADAAPAPRADETTLLPPLAAPAPGRRAAGSAHRPLPELAALAAAGRSASQLVWHRVRRGQRLVATLRSDGLIELEDGSLHAHPDAAASVAADLETPTDGWRVWRFGEEGPTLGEAVGVSR